MYNTCILLYIYIFILLKGSSLSLIHTQEAQEPEPRLLEKYTASSFTAYDRLLPAKRRINGGWWCLLAKAPPAAGCPHLQHSALDSTGLLWYQGFNSSSLPEIFETSLSLSLSSSHQLISPNCPPTVHNPRCVKGS